MSGFVAFLLLVSGMGVGTLICGLLPLSLPLSHRMMRVLEVFGAGLLVGAAVTVVIPEGSSALFANVTPSTAAPASVYTNVLHPASAFRPIAPLQATHVESKISEEPWAWSFISKRSQQPSHDHDHDHEHGPDEHDAPNTQKPFTNSDAEHRLGSSILFGIVLMYVIDQFTSGSANSSSSHNHDKSQDGALPNHHHHHDYAATPSRPRLETHRLSKSFHQKADPNAASNTLHKVSSRASFTVFDRSQHGITNTDEEARIGTQDHNEPHRRIDSIATASSSSDNDLPDDYDDHDAEHYQHADLKRVTSSHGNAEWHSSPRSSTTTTTTTTTTLHRDTPESSSAPLLHRRNSFTSVNSARPRPGRSRSTSSTHTGHATFGQALTTIVGLLIHATADGIAMGASAQSGDQTLTMVVFVAIMVHKAPAAFGLCAMLMSQRLSRTSIRKAVGVFALASPLGAVLTYALLAAFFDADISSAHGGSGGEGIDGKSIGTALAFSGGTFLFVAFHAVLELAGAEADIVPREDGETQILGKWLRITLLIAGGCTPRLLQSLLASFGGSHHH
ncbi:related to ATX2 - Golgi membrane protein involved in manganese homeostasis [Ustilago trichophora]|uniref:Related to ATX2 - Golgi membrane protein involved in manganese homeostasis n=1 Tax=Ustilago trichophora TaxID=86804 RepID=A0A5C3DSM7_9BASI|nr:related to ATX2 - Golgi membrane protein involved in manganese homeostasis [Ustilago trichophora]